MDRAQEWMYTTLCVVSSIVTKVACSLTTFGGRRRDFLSMGASNDDDRLDRRYAFGSMLCSMH